MPDNAIQSVNRRGILRVLGSLGALAASGVTAATPGRGTGEKPGEILVGGALDEDVDDVAAEANAASPPEASVVHRNQTLGYVALELPGDERAREAVKSAIGKRSGVEYVEDNVSYGVQLVPNDPRFDDQYAPQLVNADDAWDTTDGSTDVTIAVVDTGVEYDHPDLASLFAADPGRDFADADGDPSPDATDEVHGTHVAGCASADTDNDVGVAGASDSRLLSARALDESGSGSLSDIADAIQWATDQGADVINMSLGGGGYTTTMKRAVEYAYDQNGVLVVCAAGNSGQSQVAYPARYEECVAVSAIDADEEFASFSNYGPSVEVTAPGVNVLSTVPSEGYDSFSGTSMAAPVATGVAALGKAAEPGLTGSELRQRLTETAADVGLPSDQQGSGRVDGANIVAASDRPSNESPTASASASATDATVGESVTFDGSDSNDPDGSLVSYDWAFGDGTTATGVTVEHAYESADEYAATLTVTDDGGATATDSVTVTVGAASECGQTASGSASSSLSAWWDQDRWSWSQQFETTCEVTVAIDGPADADFDLYVTADGRRPTTDDYDARSISRDSSESTTLSAIDDGVGILVDSYHGSGQYTVSVEEHGSGGASTATGDGPVPVETDGSPDRERDEKPGRDRGADGSGSGPNRGDRSDRGKAKRA